MVTLAQLQSLYPRAPGAHLQAFADQAAAIFTEFGIDRLPNRLQFFLAQIGHESGGLTIFAENLNYSAARLTVVWPSRFPTLAAAQPYAGNPEKLANNVYASRMGNGPPASGDGYRFRGRGYIQITGRDAYAAIGALTGIDLLHQPDEAFAPDNALRVACGFWKWKNLNALCDSGDFTAVTRRINGGTTGLADRLAWLDKVRRTLAVPPPVPAQPSAATVIAVQKALRDRGFTSIGAADGIVGPRTTAAITQFRTTNGLGPGLIDARLLDVLGIDGG